MTGRKLLPGRPLLASEIRDYLIDRRDSSEILSTRFLARLKELNRLVKETGEIIEGGIFYWDNDPHYENALPDPTLAAARRNLWRATRFKDSMLEVGVNAGHSALVALSCNDELIYHGVDIASHAYTERCVDYLASEFPGRVHLHRGDSREVLPDLASRRPELDFDIFHVDGGHTSEVCYADVSNCVRLARGRPGKHLLIDDIHASWIFDIYAEFISKGRLTTETFFGDWEDDNRNVLARIL
jgi:hypothetical protein